MTRRSGVSRREAREAAMSAVFAAQTGGDGTAALAVERLAGMQEGRRKQLAREDELTAAIVRVFDYRREDIDAWMADAYARPLANMTLVERAIIAAAAAEALGHPDTPQRVIINEAVELAKRFGAEGGGGLVNGVLSALSERLRQG